MSLLVTLIGLFTVLSISATPVWNQTLLTNKRSIDVRAPEKQVGSPLDAEVQGPNGNEDELVRKNKVTEKEDNHDSHSEALRRLAMMLKTHAKRLKLKDLKKRWFYGWPSSSSSSSSSDSTTPAPFKICYICDINKFTRRRLEASLSRGQGRRRGKGWLRQ